ncbi:MAG TPA: hypothetical protein VLA04_02525 [Verrucomicrobiae bacterium]|nr:hypothetical protein [Verrucomicrobiae bacterium]
MARRITPALISAILVGAVVLGVVGFQAYLYMATTPAEVPATAHAFETQVIATELDPQKEKGVFALTVPLTTTTAATSGGVNYSPSELGKVDITRAGN